MPTFNYLQSIKNTIRMLKNFEKEEISEQELIALKRENFQPCETMSLQALLKCGALTKYSNHVYKIDLQPLKDFCFVYKKQVIVDLNNRIAKKEQKVIDLQKEIKILKNQRNSA